MEVSENKVVAVAYELRVDTPEGELVDKAERETPFTFLVGTGNVIEQFESNLKGKQPGDAFNFSIESESAYGPIDERAIVDVPKEAFTVEGQVANDLLQEGKYLQMQDQNGNPLRGKIVNVEDNAVKMDFNHPMAGKDLFFSGEVVEVREASQEELEHGHVHGPGGHEH